jgi:hypothetical protein
MRVEKVQGIKLTPPHSPIFRSPLIFPKAVVHLFLKHFFEFLKPRVSGENKNRQELVFQNILRPKTRGALMSTWHAFIKMVGVCTIRFRLFFDE